MNPRRLFAGLAVVFSMVGFPAGAQVSTPQTVPATTRTDSVAQSEDLSRALRVDEIATILRDEGVIYGLELDRDMLGGTGGDYWKTLVEDLYSPGRVSDAVLMALINGLTDEQRAECLRFFNSEAGQSIVSLEISARVALQTPEIEQAARDAYLALRDQDDPRLAVITAYVEANDLIERNVAGAMSFSYSLYRGLVDGGALEWDEQTILTEVWREEEANRAETESWIYSMLLMAYQPLSDAVLQENLEFAVSPAGRALNAALFDGFDMVYRDIAYGLGLGLAGASGSSEL